MEWNIVLTLCWCKTRWTVISSSFWPCHKLTRLLKASGLGCRYNNTYIGCLCYADDIILISHLVTVMQTMLDLCDMFSADFDVKFNTTKTVAMMIGPRFDAFCADLTLSGGIIEYVQSLKYLDV